MTLTRRHFLNSGIVLWPGVVLRGNGFLSAGPDQGLPGSVLAAAPLLRGPLITMRLDPQNTKRYSFPGVADLSLVGSPNNPAQDGVFLDPANGNILDVQLTNVGFFNLGGNGLHAACENQKVFATNCYFENCERNGVLCGTGAVRLLQCYVYGNLWCGVDAQNAWMFSSIGCWYVNNHRSAIAVGPSRSGFVIVGNQFMNCGGPSYPTIDVLQESSTTCVLNDNIFNDSRGTIAASSHVFAGRTGPVRMAVVGNQFAGARALGFGPVAGHCCVVDNNIGYNNAIGRIATPFNGACGALAVYGTSAAPASNTTYKATVGAVFVACTGGAGVRITLFDATGSAVQTRLTSFAGPVPAGWSINFGPFTLAPTVLATVL